MKYNNNKLENDLKLSILNILPQPLPMHDGEALFKMDELSYKVGWNSAIIEVKSRLGLYPDTVDGVRTETPNTNSAQLSAKP